ncbi:MAG: hypothetical protein JWM68_3064 [Verrucomicrobiales bacterium]|nr:hypothetical protein [Verrucomicrobiales bacterium]
MKPITRWLVFVGALLVLALVLVFLIRTAPKNPVALIRVVDAAGKPIVGAVVQPEGLRTKSGPYRSGWYGWSTGKNKVPNPPVATDADGYARVPYPKYVFELIETGTLCLKVDHPDFVPQRPERIVAIALPAGAPWQARLDDLWNRIKHNTLLARADPVALQKGATVKIVVRPGTTLPKESRLFAQMSNVATEGTNFWTRPEAGVLVTRSLSAGPHDLRVIQLRADGSCWFSDMSSITAVIGQTNDVVVDFKRGATLRGQLDETVPRPVKNGRVVAHVWPTGSAPAQDPPQWHAWSKVNEDGSFTIGSLPAGDLEVVAMCDGFLSTNGPGKFGMRYPQQHLLGTNDLTVTIGMEQTACLEVQVNDNQGRPLKDARLVSWPNVRYGEWSATVLMSDCYNMAEILAGPPYRWDQDVSDFEAVTDATGFAVLPNMPAIATEFSVMHPQFDLPAVGPAGDQKRREASITLAPGQTNRITVQMELKEQAPITHY